MTDEFINYYRENISKKSQIIKGVNEFLAWGNLKILILLFVQIKWNL